MRDLLDVRLPRRVVGRQALTKSLRALLIRTRRYGMHRARTRDELQWAAAFVDGLTVTLAAVAPRAGGASPADDAPESRTA